MISAPLFCRRFVGRHDELEFIVERFRESRLGRGAIVLIGGDAGVGKSRLLAEARSRVAKGNVRILTGQCLEHAQAPLAHRRTRPAARVARNRPSFLAGRTPNP